MSWVSRILFWLAGADRALLERCPASERIKFGAIGAAVLVPTVTGFGSMLFYASKHLTNPFALVLISGVWAFFILTIDRLLLTTYRPFSSFFGKRLWQILLRLFLALFISTAIAHPICLQQFSGVIKRRHQAGLAVEIKKHKEEQAAKIADIDQRYSAPIAQAQKELDATRNTPDPTLAELEENVQKKLSLRAPQAPQLAASESRMAALEKELNSARAEVAKQVANENAVGDAINSEMADGKNPLSPGGDTPKKPGYFFSIEQRHNEKVCPRMAWLYKHQEEVEKNKEEALTRVHNLTLQLQQARQSGIGLQEKANEARATIEAAVRTEVEKETQLGAQGRATHISELEKQLADLNGKSQKEHSDVDDSYRSLLADLEARYDRPLDPMEETLALSKAITEPEYGEADSGSRRAAGLFQFVLTFGIFLLIDLIPILAKMMSTGPYDELVHAAEQALREEHKALISLNGQFARRRVHDALSAETRRHLEAIHARDSESVRANGRAHSPTPPPNLTTGAA